MKTEIKGIPSFGYIDVTLEPGESICCESDAMASMSSGLDMDVKLNGGFFSAIFKRFFGDESFFLSHFKNNTQQSGKIVIVQDVPGEIRELTLNGNSYCLQPGAYLASTGDVKLGIKWAGFVSFIAREGLFKLVVSGNGKVWFGAYGGLLEHEVDGDFLVDTSHLVAYEPQMKLKLQFAGGIFSSILGGEGLVTRMEGKGKIIIQSRSLSGLSSWINPKFW